VPNPFETLLSPPPRDFASFARENAQSFG
jgi:hypothetical protein